jgi:hypothetical protein
MSVEFLPLTGLHHYASSLAGDSPCIVAAMFTTSMQHHADRLRSSLEAAGLSFALYLVPSVHCSISPRGSNELAFCKPNFIHYVLNEHRKPILYLDADMVMREPPAKILRAAHGQSIDFGCYNWLADRVTDAYRPVEVVWNDKVVKNRYYGFSHSIDLFDPTQLLISGGAQFYTLEALALLHAWLRAIERFPTVADDELLDYAYNFIIDKRAIRTSWWDKDYCRYPWWIYVRPVIDHPQWPAAGNNPARHFRSAAGHERFKEHGVAALRPQVPEAPFPRDCLIDTHEKRLLRKDRFGRTSVVGAVTIELWTATHDRP